MSKPSSSYQQRWQAFAASRGLHPDSSLLTTADYLAFLRDMEFAYCEEKGLTIGDMQTAGSQTDFTQFIWAKVLNKEEV